MGISADNTVPALMFQKTNCPPFADDLPLEILFFFLVTFCTEKTFVKIKTFWTPLSTFTFFLSFYFFLISHSLSLSLSGKHSLDRTLTVYWLQVSNNQSVSERALWQKSFMWMHLHTLTDYLVNGLQWQQLLFCDAVFIVVPHIWTWSKPQMSKQAFEDNFYFFSHLFLLFSNFFFLFFFSLHFDRFNVMSPCTITMKIFSFSLSLPLSTRLMIDRCFAHFVPFLSKEKIFFICSLSFGKWSKVPEQEKERERERERMPNKMTVTQDCFIKH